MVVVVVVVVVVVLVVLVVVVVVLVVVVVVVGVGVVVVASEIVKTTIDSIYILVVGPSMLGNCPVGQEIQSIMAKDEKNQN